MAIEIVNKQRLARIDKVAVIRVAQEALAAINADNVGLTVAFVRDREMKRSTVSFGALINRRMSFRSPLRIRFLCRTDITARQEAFSWRRDHLHR